MIPQKLVDFAGLGREVVMAGVLDWLEVWDRKEWIERTQVDRERLKGSLAEGMKPKLS